MKLINPFVRRRREKKMKPVASGTLHGRMSAKEILLQS
tara:strand:+ start:271 stop:384 length:114 start_codon:yes stop_codon:yes gene_type:complete